MVFFMEQHEKTEARMEGDKESQQEFLHKGVIRREGRMIDLCNLYHFRLQVMAHSQMFFSAEMLHALRKFNMLEKKNTSPYVLASFLHKWDFLFYFGET